MPARFHPLDHQRIDARPDQFLRQTERRRKADDFGATCLDRIEASCRREPTGKDDVRYLMPRANIDQIHQHRMHRDQVDAEGFGRARLRLGNFGIEQFGGHRPARNQAKAACVGDGRHQMPLADPRHRPAHDGNLRAKERGPARHQVGQAGQATSSASNPYAVCNTRTASSV